MELSGLLAQKRLQKRGKWRSCDFQQFLQHWTNSRSLEERQFCTEIQKRRTGWPKQLRVHQSNAEQGKITEYLILDSNNKELESGNKINVNQIRSMENRFCQTKLTSFLMSLQVWLTNFKNVDLIALIYLVFYKALDLVLLINWLKQN